MKTWIYFSFHFEICFPSVSFSKLAMDFFLQRFTVPSYRISSFDVCLIRPPFDWHLHKICVYGRPCLWAEWDFAEHSRWWWVPPLSGQRRRTIPRGAQFCSIYLQDHINKCCRIVQLLKSKAAWWGGDAQDESSLRRWWRWKRVAARDSLRMKREGKWRVCPYFFRFIPHKYCVLVFFLEVPSVKIITQTRHKAFIAPPLRRHCPYFAYQHNGASLLLFSHIIKFITLHLWQIETQFFLRTQHDTVHFQTKQKVIKTLSSFVSVSQQYPCYLLMVTGTGLVRIIRTHLFLSWTLWC